MPPPRFDPLSNPGTSAVLFLIIRGVDTPTDIAKKLRVRPPAIMDQLSKLAKLQVIRSGDKVGKERHYTINWNSLAIETIRRTVAPHYGPGAYEEGHAAWLVKSFPEFTLFLRTYLTTLLSSKPKDVGTLAFYPTLSEQIEVLYATLTSELDGILTHLPTDASLVRRVSDSLRQWVRDGQPVDTVSVELIAKTLEKLTSPQGDADFARFEAISLKAGLITKNEKTGMHQLTDAGMRFLKDYEDYEKSKKVLPAWLRNKQEARLVISKLSAIPS